jgi:hypothetical protein
MRDILTYLGSNLNYILSVLSLFFLAGINSMPSKIPSNVNEWYLWLRDSLQTAIPINRRTDKNNVANVDNSNFFEDK